MQIAYLHKKKLKEKPKVDPEKEILEDAYLRDIRKLWIKNKNYMASLGVSEDQFIKEMKSRLL